jgi:hypothetical protein
VYGNRGEGLSVANAGNGPRGTRKADVRKVIDTLNDLDNVLYEITNETAIYSEDWQYHNIRYIKEYEATKRGPDGDFMRSHIEVAENWERESTITSYGYKKTLQPSRAVAGLETARLCWERNKTDDPFRSRNYLHDERPG